MSVSNGAYSTAVPPHSVGATPQEAGFHVWASTLNSVSSDSTQSAVFFLFILCLTVWGVVPDVTHQTSWLGSTGECGVPQNQVGEHFAQRTA